MDRAPNTIPFTKSGYDQIVQERDQLQTSRPHAVEELSRARDEGDRSENAAYKAARWTLSGLDKRLRFLNRLIENSYVCTPTQIQTIEIGHYVKLKTNSKEITYQIVGINEANPKLKKISYQSPLGAGLIHKRVGDHVAIQSTDGSRTYTIIHISLE